MLESDAERIESEYYGDLAERDPREVFEDREFFDGYLDEED